MSEGKAVAVCLSATGGVPKQTQDQIRIRQYGVNCDYHAGEYRTNGKGERELNRRHVTVVASEAIEAVSRLIGVEIPHGGVEKTFSCAAWVILVRSSPDSDCASCRARSWR